MSESQKRVSDKIRFLRHEGKSERAAVGEAEGMEDSGRLRRHGRYVHKRKGRGRKGRRKGGRR